MKQNEIVAEREEAGKILCHSCKSVTLPKQKRMTKQKALIWDILSKTKSHPTADWVYAEARKEMPNISLGTVYRNLQLLVADGMAKELNYGKGFSRFDANTGQHYHFVCQHCGRIEDITPSLKEDMITTMQTHVHGKIQRYRLEFYGICEQCLAESVTGEDF